MGAILVGFSALVFIFRDQIIRLSHYGYIGLFVIAAVSSASVFCPGPGPGIGFCHRRRPESPRWSAWPSAPARPCGELTGYLAGVGGHGLDRGSIRATSESSGWMKRYGMWVVFVLAVIPNPLFDIVGIISGVLRIPVWRFFCRVLGRQCDQGDGRRLRGHGRDHRAGAGDPAVDGEVMRDCVMRGA